MADRTTHLQGVFSGKTGILKEEGQPSAIVKTFIHDRLTLTKLGHVSTAARAVVSGNARYQPPDMQSAAH